MSQWLRTAHCVRSLAPLEPLPGRRLLSGVHLLLEARLRPVWTAAASFRDALARAGREEKVALLGLALVLMVLSWP